MRTLVLALLLLAPLLAATAEAQVGLVATSVQVSIQDPGRALVPGRNETVPVTLNYIWQPGARPAPASNGTVYPEPTRVTFTVLQVPSWVIEAHVYPAELLVELPTNIGLNGNRAVDGISLNLTLDPNAPALQREEVVIEATAAPNGNMAGSTGQSPAIKLRADIVAVLNVTAEAPDVVVKGGRWNTVDFTVRNEGNYDLVAKLNLTLKPENAETRFPTEVTIKRGESVVVPVEIRTPWTEAELGTLELEATPVLEDDDGDSVTASVEIQGTSAVPGPGLAPLLVCLAVLAWRARRRA